MKQIKVFIKEPGMDGHVENTYDDYKELQKIVGGFLESLTLYPNEKIVLLCDEDGKLKNKIPNIKFRKDVIVGTVVFTSYDMEGAFKSLTQKQIRFLEEKFNSNTIKEK